MSETKDDAFSWRLLICGVTGAVILVLPQMIFGGDALAIFGTIPLAVLIVVVLIAVAFNKARRHGIAVLGMFLVFLALAWFLFRSANHLRTSTRWLVHSRSYKRQMSAQQTPPGGFLKHQEWDGWGFAGAGDTVVYLVLDPSDQLAKAAKSHSPGKFEGLPCEVARVSRLESQWYTVLFYTDTDWDHCSSSR